MVKGTASLGQFSEISSALTRALPKGLEDLDPKEVISAVRHGEQLECALNRMFRSLVDESDYIIITDDGVKKTSEIVAEMRKHFKDWCYWNDAELDKQFPPPPKPTTRKFKNTQEPDKDTLGQSVRKVDMDGKRGITLRERLLMGLAYWKRTGRHLDINGVHFVAVLAVQTVVFRACTGIRVARRCTCIGTALGARIRWAAFVEQFKLLSFFFFSSKKERCYALCCVAPIIL